MLLEIKGLNSFYGLSHVLNNVSLDIEKGEIVALLGRNGMGKSTTLKSIMGLVRPKSGRIVFNGKDVCGQSPHRIAMAGIGYVPEERRIFPTLSVMDNLQMGIKKGRGHRSGSYAWTFEKIFDYFPFMKERTHQKGGHLSGGEQQMLTIARALMGNPELLLVDEPTEGLSPVMVDTVRKVLADARSAGVSILLVEHNFKMAMSIADRVYLMGKAHIGYSGTADELKSCPDVSTRFLEV